MRNRPNVARHKRIKRLTKKSKGRYLGRRKLLRTMIEAQVRSEYFATRDRRAKKRDFHRLWITRISAACRENGISYSQFINGLTKAEYLIDRRVISDLAISDPAAFKALVELAKSKLA